MIVPKSIRINGVEYTINDVENLNDGAHVLYGNVTWEDSTIRLKSDQGHQHKCITLWHEILHALIHHGTLTLDDDVEESICETLGYGIYQVLQDNARRLFDITAEQTKE